MEIAHLTSFKHYSIFIICNEKHRGHLCHFIIKMYSFPFIPIKPYLVVILMNCFSIRKSFENFLPQSATRRQWFSKKFNRNTVEQHLIDQYQRASERTDEPKKFYRLFLEFCWTLPFYGFVSSTFSLIYEDQLGFKDRFCNLIRKTFCVSMYSLYIIYIPFRIFGYDKFLFQISKVESFSKTIMT